MNTCLRRAFEDISFLTAWHRQKPLALRDTESNVPIALLVLAKLWLWFIPLQIIGSIYSSDRKDGLGLLFPSWLQLDVSYGLYLGVSLAYMAFSACLFQTFFFILFFLALAGSAPLSFGLMSAGGGRSTLFPLILPVGISVVSCWSRLCGPESRLQLGFGLGLFVPAIAWFQPLLVPG